MIPDRPQKKKRLFLLAYLYLISTTLRATLAPVEPPLPVPLPPQE